MTTRLTPPSFLRPAAAGPAALLTAPPQAQRTTQRDLVVASLLALPPARSGPSAKMGSGSNKRHPH
jgi:hypothetical protein